MPNFAANETVAAHRGEEREPTAAQAQRGAMLDTFPPRPRIGCRHTRAILYARLVSTGVRPPRRHATTGTQRRSSSIRIAELPGQS